ncbi:MAG TPA: DUF397 domain-containing protein [Streptosporangiaceae bacterium]
MAYQDTAVRGEIVYDRDDIAALVTIWDRTKDPEGPKLTFTPADWQSFTASVQAGRHSLG